MAKVDLLSLVLRQRVRPRGTVAWEVGGELVWARALEEGIWDLLREELLGSSVGWGRHSDSVDNAHRIREEIGRGEVWLSCRS